MTEILLLACALFMSCAFADETGSQAVKTEKNPVSASCTTSSSQCRTDTPSDYQCHKGMLNVCYADTPGCVFDTDCPNGWTCNQNGDCE